jgi:uncharacterized protein YndB with AHSA1/START domain
MADAREITISRVYDAPRQLVWDAWTKPDQLARWWGPPGWTTDPAAVTMDVRPGGVFRLVSVSDAGAEMPMEAVFREVVEPERLVMEEPSEGNWHDGSVSELTLHDLGDGRTEMVLRARIRCTDEMAAHAERGMNGTLDRLAEHLA